jgi:hypothetical protein
MTIKNATKQLRRAGGLAEIRNISKTSPQHHAAATCMMIFKLNERNITSDGKQYSLFSITERLFFILSFIGW